jgi:hypothetical protein
VAITGTPTLTSVDLPALTAVAGTLAFEDDVALTSLNLPALTVVAIGFSVHDNPTLPQCQVSAIVARLVAPPTTVLTAGNDTAATCP